MFDDSLYSFYQLFVDDGLVADLYQQELLTTLTLVALLIAFVTMFFFYYVLNRNSPRYSGPGHWLSIWLCSGLITFLFMLSTCIVKANEAIPRTENPDDGFLFNQDTLVFAAFSFWMALITLLLFFIFSIVGKGFSVQAKHRPFLWPNNVR